MNRSRAWKSILLKEPSGSYSVKKTVSVFLYILRPCNDYSYTFSCNTILHFTILIDETQYINTFYDIFLNTHISEENVFENNLILSLDYFIILSFFLLIFRLKLVIKAKSAGSLYIISSLRKIHHTSASITSRLSVDFCMVTEK